MVGLLPARAQDAGSLYDLSWFTLDAGGGTSTDGFFELSATLGQPDPGVLSDGFYRIEGGFWAAALPAPPVITTQPSSVRVDFNANITLSVGVSGTAPFLYQWRLNGIHLRGATNATLNLSQVQLAQGGSYTVLVENEFGAVGSEPATLSFNLPETPPGDDFADRVVIVVNNTLFTGSNAGATTEIGEPRHAGKLGGSSVRYAWTAPATAVKHFLANEQDRARAVKRGGGQKLFSLDQPRAEDLPPIEPVSDLSPVKTFERQWAVTLFQQVERSLKQEYAAAGKEQLFDRLREFVETRAGSGEYTTAAAELQMSPGAVAVAVHRLRQRFGELVRAEVAQTLVNPTAAEVETERRHLYELFTR